MGYYCDDCGWHPCRCNCVSCGAPLRHMGMLMEQCGRCLTHYPLRATGRPPIVALWPDGARRLCCPCGLVLLQQPGDELPRQCPACQRRYRWPGQPPEPLPLTPPYTNGRVHLEPREDGRVPLVQLTEINCLLCGRVISVARHDPGTDYHPSPSDQRLSCTWQSCGGSPIRGETYTRFVFVGKDIVSIRPPD